LGFDGGLVGLSEDIPGAINDGCPLFWDCEEDSGALALKAKTIHPETDWICIRRLFSSVSIESAQVIHGELQALSVSDWGWDGALRAHEQANRRRRQ